MKKYFVAALLILIFIFSFKFFFTNRFTPVTSGYRGFINEKKVDYLFIGSSETRQGLNPNILEDSLRNIYLLAYNGNSFYYIDFLLGMIARNNRIPKKIIVEANPIRAYLKKEISDIRLFNELNYHNKINFLKASKDILTAWDAYELIMLSGNEGIVTYPVLKKFLNSLSYKGGYLNKIVPGMTAQKFGQISSPFDDSAKYTNLDPDQVTALNHIILFARQHNVDLMFLEAPVAKNIQESIVFKKAQAELKKTIEAFSIKFVSPEDYDLNIDDPSLFNDGLHLSTEGRDIYTKSIIQYLR